MTLVDFYENYLHYSVSQRLFEDACRQLRDFVGELSERQALVDETLRLSMAVSDNIDAVEGMIADTIEYIQSNDIDNPELLEEIALITNNLKEDRARANSYSNFITFRRMGNTDRRPRKPQIANPFNFSETEDEPVRPSLPRKYSIHQEEEEPKIAVEEPPAELIAKPAIVEEDSDEDEENTVGPVNPLIQEAVILMDEIKGQPLQTKDPEEDPEEIEDSDECESEPETEEAEESDGEDKPKSRLFRRVPRKFNRHPVTVVNSIRGNFRFLFRIFRPRSCPCSTAD